MSELERPGGPNWAKLEEIGKRLGLTLAKEGHVEDGTLHLPKVAIMEALVEAYELGADLDNEQWHKLSKRVAELDARSKRLADSIGGTA